MNCIRCGTSFQITNRPNQKFCTAKCYDSYHKAQSKKARHRRDWQELHGCVWPNKKCAVCATVFNALSSHGKTKKKYCSVKCLKSVPRKPAEPYIKQIRNSECWFCGKLQIVEGSGPVPNCCSKECETHRKRANRFSLSKEEYLTLSATCEICGVKADAIDHDHSTGAVRGHLCKKCNTGIGMLGDNLRLLQNAVAYLEKQQ